MKLLNLFRIFRKGTIELTSIVVAPKDEVTFTIKTAGDEADLFLTFLWLMSTENKLRKMMELAMLLQYVDNEKGLLQKLEFARTTLAASPGMRSGMKKFNDACYHGYIERILRELLKDECNAERIEQLRKEKQFAEIFRKIDGDNQN